MHELESSSIYVAGQHPDQPRYPLKLRDLEGGFGPGRSAGIIKDVTPAILDAEESRDDVENASRVWCLLEEVQVGKWRMDGAVYFRGADRSGLKG